MTILNQTKEALDKQLGSPKKANILVGGDEHFRAEEAWRYNLGRFDVTIGFSRGVSRYACFYKEPLDKPAFDDGDVEVSLSLVAPSASWSACERDSNSSGAQVEPSESDTPDSSWVIAEYSTSIPDISGKEFTIIACHQMIKPHFLAYSRVVVDTQSTKSQDQSTDADGKLDELLLNASTATTAAMKIDAIVAAMNELVAQHRALRDQLPKIRERRKD